PRLRALPESTADRLPGSRHCPARPPPAREPRRARPPSAAPRSDARAASACPRAATDRRPPPASRADPAGRRNGARPRGPPPRPLLIAFAVVGIAEHADHRNGRRAELVRQALRLAGTPVLGQVAREQQQIGALCQRLELTRLKCATLPAHVYVPDGRDADHD